MTGKQLESNAVLKTYARLMVGPDEKVVEVESRDAQSLESRFGELAADPVCVWGYQFFDQAEVTVDGEKEPLKGARRNLSGTTYFGTEVKLDNVEEVAPGLSGNLSYYLNDCRWDGVVLNRFGDWTEMNDGDQVVETPQFQPTLYLSDRRTYNFTPAAALEFVNALIGLGEGVYIESNGRASTDSERVMADGLHVPLKEVNDASEFLLNKVRIEAPSSDRSQVLAEFDTAPGGNLRMNVSIKEDLVLDPERIYALAEKYCTD